jgi:hypothetical protein
MGAIMRSGFCFLVLVLGALASSAAASDWHAEANYPARIAAFQFGGNVLDATHTIKFGSWTVSFNADGPPIYQVFHYQGGGMNYSSASRGNSSYGLVCSNSISGSFNCAIVFSPTTGACALAIGNNQPLPIDCPTDVTFQ